MSQSSEWPLKSSVIESESVSIFASVCASQKPFLGPPVFYISRFSSWNKLLLTIAAVFSFFTKLSSSSAKDQDSNGKHRKERQHSTSSDIERARIYIIISAQREFFSETIENLHQKRRLEAKNKLIKFNPYLDQKHMLRSRSRLEFAPQMELESSHPLILLATHPTLKLYLQHAHQNCMHQGQEFVKFFVQQRYHIIGIQQALRSIAHHCFLFRRYQADNLQPVMAPLPLKRYPDENHLFPFTNAGVDFFCPFFMENKTDIEKLYGIIPTCFATRAVHFKNCRNLNTDSFMNAIDRFTARRGTPKTITSDNGKEFVGASKELKKRHKIG